MIKLTILNPITKISTTFYTFRAMGEAAASVINTMEDTTPMRDLPNNKGDWVVTVSFV